MKRQSATDAKKAAANDKENGNDKAEKAKVSTSLRTVPPETGRYAIGATETVKRGFLKQFCDFTRKKGTVDTAMLIASSLVARSLGTRSTQPESTAIFGIASTTGSSRSRNERPALPAWTRRRDTGSTCTAVGEAVCGHDKTVGQPYDNFAARRCNNEWCLFVIEIVILHSFADYSRPPNTPSTWRMIRSAQATALEING